MTTYRGHDIDALRGRGGWRAYVDMHDLDVNAKTRDEALSFARRWVDEAWRRYGIVWRIAANSQGAPPTLRVIDGGRDG